MLGGERGFAARGRWALGAVGKLFMAVAAAPQDCTQGGGRGEDWTRELLKRGGVERRWATGGFGVKFYLRGGAMVGPWCCVLLLELRQAA